MPRGTHVQGGRGLEEGEEFGGAHFKEPRPHCPGCTGPSWSGTASASCPQPTLGMGGREPIPVCWTNERVKKEEAAGLGHCGYEFGNQIGTFGHKVGCSLGRHSCLTPPTEGPGCSPAPPSRMPLKSQPGGAGTETGHLFPSPFPRLWFSFSVGAPQCLPPAPLCSSPLSPGNVSTLKASRCSLC